MFHEPYNFIPIYLTNGVIRNYPFFWLVIVYWFESSLTNPFNYFVILAFENPFFSSSLLLYRSQVTLLCTHTNLSFSPDMRPNWKLGVRFNSNRSGLVIWSAFNWRCSPFRSSLSKLRTSGAASVLAALSCKPQIEIASTWTMET